MKKIAVFVLMAAFALVSCQKGAQKTSADVHTFGMKGDVKNVFYSVLLLETSSEDEQGDPWLEQDELLMSFDREGRVIQDEYGNLYIYDTEGNFIAGTSQWSTITRDAKGRLVSYDCSVLDEEGNFLDDDLDVFNENHFTYTYDAKDRVATEEYTGWEWGADYKYEYEGDKFYPSRITFESYNEGYNETGTIDYDYREFDDKGNWTVRLVTTTTDSWEEPWDDSEPEVETDTYVNREYRKITYWSDKD